MNKGNFFVISGPSGVGKDTIIAELKKRIDNLGETISATTRQKREHEKYGEHYFFHTRESFEEKIANDDFVEYATFAGNYYGTLKSELYSKLENGLNIISNIEVQGASKIMNTMDEAITIFILPPSLEELERRIRARKTDTEEYILMRLEQAKFEISLSSNYDHIIVNDNLEDAISNIENIINSYIKNEEQ